MTDPRSPAPAVPPGRLLVVCDVDSTFVEQEVVDLLAARAGTREEVAAITDAAMRGELDFGESLRRRVATLSGLPASVFAEVGDELVLSPGAERLTRGLQAGGHALALVSGGFAEVVGPLAAALGIAHVRANRLEVVAGRLTGRLAGPVVDRAAKARALREIADAEGIPRERTVAVGDGANDLEMLEAAGLGVAYRAKPVLARRAGLVLPGSRLDALLDVLGVSAPPEPPRQEPGLRAVPPGGC